MTGLSQGWAIGTQAWRTALAKGYAQSAHNPGLHAEEVKELREAAWTKSLEAGLGALGKTRPEFDTKPWKQPWKIALALKVRVETGAFIPWLAEQSKIVISIILRGYLHRAK